MTATRFVEFCENVYCEKLHEDAANTLLEYLYGCREDYISALAEVVRKRHPRQYKIAPGPAELDKYKIEAYELWKERRVAEKKLAAPQEPPLSQEDRDKMIEEIHGILEKLRAKANITPKEVGECS